MFSTRNVMASAVALALLAGCGGGSDAGPGTDNSGGSPLVPSASVTEANAPGIAGSISGEANEALVLGADVIGHSLVELFSVSAPASAVSVAPRNAGHADGSATHSPEAMVTCHDGGTQTVTIIDVNDNAAFDAGDERVVVFDACIDGSHEIDGTLEVTLVTLEGDPTVGAPYEVHATVNAKNLVVGPVVAALSAGHGTDVGHVSDGSATLNGVVAVDIHATATQESFELESAPLLTIVKGDKTIRLFEVAISSSHDETSGAKTNTFDGVIDVSGVGAVRMETRVPFEVLSGAEHPSAGKLKLQGLESSLTITAGTDGESVTLDVDSDNDDVIDVTVNRMWADL